MDENHDTIIRHECEIGELKEQNEFILKRLDEQDKNDVVIKDELIEKAPPTLQSDLAGRASFRRFCGMSMQSCR